MVGDDLYAVGSGPKGVVGLYRLPDKNHDDKADDVPAPRPSPRGNGRSRTARCGFWSGRLALSQHGQSRPYPRKEARADFARPRLRRGLSSRPEIRGCRRTRRRHQSAGRDDSGFTPDSKHWWLETSGFRNEYDFAFNTAGDLFTFDADMEWDVGAYWYRPVRVNHCTAGAEFGWRSGAGSGRPTISIHFPGPSTWDAARPPESFSTITAISRTLPRLLDRLRLVDGTAVGVSSAENGHSYTGTFETFLTGNPLNVTDVEVDRDGSILFTTGGRASEGGVYRLRHKGGSSKPVEAANVAELLRLPQIESAWARNRSPGQSEGRSEVGGRTGCRRAVAGPSGTTPRVDAAQPTRTQARSQAARRRLDVEGRRCPCVRRTSARFAYGRARAHGARAAFGRCGCHRAEAPARRLSTAGRKVLSTD